VRAHLIRDQQKQQSVAKAAAKQALAAADTASGVQTGNVSFKTDPSAPIEVEADQLDVMDNAKVAVFRGDVHATQGDFEIKSAELNAFYSGDASLADVGRPVPGTAKPSATALTRIEAKKDVVVTSKDGQRASGDWANFDAKTNMATVGGDVVLTQGQNVVRGTRLVINMTSGESTIDTAPPMTAARPAGAGWVTEAPPGETPENQGRASAIFFPQQMKDAKTGKNAAKSGAQSAPDGWEARTDPGSPKKSGN
jgi:lipopolysaccharide export system protein LptA